MNGPVYSKYDNISDVQYKSMSTDETETNIEDSVIYDGDRDLCSRIGTIMCAALRVGSPWGVNHVPQ